MIEIYADGGSRGNPGEAAIGYLILKNGKEIYRHAEKLGRSTNNVAEYRAFIEAIKALLKIDPEAAKDSVKVFSDSELIVKQINGEYKVKSQNIKPLYEDAIGLLKNFNSIRIIHIPREKNKVADFLVNQALDEKMDKKNDELQVS